MVSCFDHDLESLTRRLPELAWKLRQVSRSAFLSGLPRGLFRTIQPDNPAAYLEEIRADLVLLSQHASHERSALLIAARIHAKIDLLVRLCVLHSDLESPVHDFSKNLMSKLVTRRQQVESLENQIASLEMQQSALQKTLALTKDVQKQLAIQAETGQLERLLTQTRDALKSYS